MPNNRQWTLAARPVGMPKESDFALVETPLPALADGQVLAKAKFLTVDPYMRGRISGMKSYAKPVEIGETMVGGAMLEVVESKNPKFAVGDTVDCYSGWQEYVISDGSNLRKVDTSLAPASAYLGVLGMPGLTSYFGLIDICNPKAGETVVVSGAAGAVGALVGQIAKILGCHVVGIAGEDDKIKYVTEELGFDGAFNYKTTDNYAAKLRELCPKGIDVYFDNVGGAITDAVFSNLNVGARISICGQISQYNNTKAELGPRLLGALIVYRAKVQGFLVSDYAPRFGEGIKAMATWIKEGKLKYRESFMDGFESTPKAFIALLNGANTGKMLVRL